MTDDDVDRNIINTFEGIKLICMQKELRFDFDHSPPMPISADRLSYSHKKISTMTPLQILCSFQTWNAAPISLKLHKCLAEIVDIILNRGVDPNAVSAKNSVVGSVAGCYFSAIKETNNKIFVRLHTSCLFGCNSRISYGGGSV